MHTETGGAVIVRIDGRPVEVDAQMTVAAALVKAGVLRTHRSIGGAARFAFCGMGACQECRVTIDRVPQRLACQVRCRNGMEIVTA